MLTLLKLGGSLITDKNRPHTARRKVITRLAGEIKRALVEDPDQRLIIGHGSGSFGHVPAKKYGTREGVTTPEEWRGFFYVWSEARALHLIVCEAFQRAGVPIISFPPSSAIISHGRSRVDWNIQPVESALDAGLVPVVYGDVVFDTWTGGSILSTEEIFMHLAERLPVNRFLLSGKDAGVFSDFPACMSIIPTVSLSQIQSIENSVSGSESVDVTGGMREKVILAAKMVACSTNASALIFSGEQTNLVYHVLKGQNSGTLIIKD